MKSFICIVLGCLALLSCAEPKSNPISASPNTNGPISKSPSPAASPAPSIKNGDYPAKGKITKINTQLKSVELDHEDIPGVMPRMIMEFYVVEPGKIDGLKVGDQVDFTLRYEDGRETIVAIKKAK
jgi:Cu/Ag efflux protein CusF